MYLYIHYRIGNPVLFYIILIAVGAYTLHILVQLSNRYLPTYNIFIVSVSPPLEPIAKNQINTNNT